MEIIKDHKQVAQIKIDIDRKYHTRHGLHLNKLGKLLFSNKIMQTIYSTLGKQLEQSSLASNKQGIQGGKNKVDGRNFDQGHIDSRKNEDEMKSIQNEVDNNNEEILNQDKDVAVSENSDNEKVEGKYRQINEVVVSQELGGGGDNKSVNLDNTMVPELTQDTTDNIQCENVDTIAETRRTSTRNKKTPSIRGNNFLW